MNERRPTDAVGESWRKWGDRPPADPLRPEDDPRWRQAYEVGLWDGGAATPRWRRIVIAGVVLVVIAFAAGRVSAAPRSVQTTTLQPGASGAIDLLDAPARASAGTSSGPSGAPRSGMPVKVLEAEASRVAPAPVGGVGAPTMSPAAGPESTRRRATSGIASFVAPAFGDRYLALPDGPGIRVRICSTISGLCLERISTDAGPDLAMQRAGRVADLSFADFGTLCGCSPRLVGLISVTVDRLDAPELTPPTTDVKP